MKNSKAFTLIELMIVVVILGILMATMLPKIIGGQEKSRDLARKADLTQISQALEMYYTDNGQYPTGKCITGAVLTNISYYMQGKDVPTDVSGLSTPGCTGSEYYYQDLTRDGLTQNSFVICSTIEEPKNANACSGCATGSGDVIHGSITSATEVAILNKEVGNLADTDKTLSNIDTLLYCIAR